MVLASQADLGRLARCRQLAGVTLRTAAAVDPSALRALLVITGDLVIGPSVAIDGVTLGELRAVDGAIRVAGNARLQGLFLPRLERAGRLEIDGNAAVTTVSLPQLTAVRGGLRITDNASLELVDLPRLASIGQELVLAGDPELALVEAGELHTAGRVELDLPRLPSDLAGRLRAAAAAP